MSLSFVSDLIIKSDDDLLNLPNAVPPSFNIMSAPSASKVISPTASIAKSPVPVAKSKNL